MWSKLWMDLFGVTSFLGIDMGFWVALSAVLLLVIGMNVVFWSMPPKRRRRTPPRKNSRTPYRTQERAGPVWGLLFLASSEKTKMGFRGIFPAAML